MSERLLDALEIVKRKGARETHEELFRYINAQLLMLDRSPTSTKSHTKVMADGYRNALIDIASHMSACQWRVESQLPEPPK